MEPLIRPPLGFAHRGARAHAPENTIESFQLALRLGASGLESDVWLTADGIPVLDHDGLASGRMRRRPISAVKRADLTASIPTLAELFEACGTDFHLSLDLKEASAAEAVIGVARAAGADLRKLWLCHHDWEQVAAWRDLDADVRLVDSTRLRRIKEGPERRAATLAEAGVDAVNMHATDWTGGLATLFHRFEVHAFGWDAQHERVLANLLHMGLDAVYSDHVDRMMEALSQAQR
jgi:glycerophosphoryl diester phosphodiesterase